MGLSADTVLHRVPELDVSLTPTGEIEIYTAGTGRRFGPNALALLDVFSVSKSLGEGIAELTPRLPGGQAYDEVLATVTQLLEAGILLMNPRPPGRSARPYPFGWYDSPGVHARILADRKRRTAFLEAMAEVIRPGDVVLDLGTGSGILAVAAVRAGAARVYAVEPSNMGASAVRVFEQNGVADRVTLVEGWSQQRSLPEPADVLTFDLVGSEPLQMGILEITLDAGQRLLRPGARVIPRTLSLGLVLVQAPEQLREAYFYSERQIEDWRRWYGIDFSPLRDAACRETVAAFVEPAEANELVRLSRTTEAWRIDLDALPSAPFCRADAEIEVSEDGLCCGVLGVSSIELSQSVRFVADPEDSGDAPHWMAPLWLAARPFRVKTGDRVRVTYIYHGRGRVQVDLERD